jgi:hypothetical protein
MKSHFVAPRKFTLTVLVLAVPMAALLAGTSLATPSAATLSQTEQSHPGAAIQPQEKSEPAAVATRLQLPAGTTIFAELAKSVNAKKVKLGDMVEAKCVLAVLSKGKVVIPNGARLIGRVTEVRRQTKEEPGSEIGLAFDRVQFSNGAQEELALEVQALGVNGLRTPMGPFSDDEADARLPQSASSTSPRRGDAYWAIRPPASGPSPVEPQQPAVASSPINRPDNHADPPQGTATLSTGSHGVVGIPGLKLAESVPSVGSVFMTAKKNVTLDAGSEMVFRVIP